MHHNWQKVEKYTFCHFLLHIQEIVVSLPLHKSCNTKDVMAYETK